MFGSAPISQFKLGQTKGRPSEMVSPPRDFQTRGQLLFGGIIGLLLVAAKTRPGNLRHSLKLKFHASRENAYEPHIFCVEPNQAPDFVAKFSSQNFFFLFVKINRTPSIVLKFLAPIFSTETSTFTEHTGNKTLNMDRK